MKVYVAAFIDSPWVYVANGHPFPDEYRQPVLADEVQTFKALITIHKVLQEGHPVVVREGQQHVNWVDSLMRGVAGEGIRGTRFRWEVVRANATTSLRRRFVCPVVDSLDAQDTAPLFGNMFSFSSRNWRSTGITPNSTVCESHLI